MGDLRRDSIREAQGVVETPTTERIDRAQPGPETGIPSSIGRPLLARVGGVSTLDAACEMTIRRKAQGRGPADAFSAADPFRAQAALREGLRVAAGGLGCADRFADQIRDLTGEVPTPRLIETLLAAIHGDLLTLGIAAADIDELINLVRPPAPPHRRDQLVNAAQPPAPMVRGDAALAAPSPATDPYHSAAQTVRKRLEALVTLMTDVSDLAPIRNQRLAHDPDGASATPVKLRQFKTESRHPNPTRQQAICVVAFCRKSGAQEIVSGLQAVFLSDLNPHLDADIERFDEPIENQDSDQLMPNVDATRLVVWAGSNFGLQPLGVMDSRGPAAGPCVGKVIDIADRATDGGSKLAAVPATSPPPCLGRLLIVDQSPSCQRLVRPLLARAGYEVALAVDPQAALDRHQAGERYDLILADTSTTGREARRLIEALGRATDWHATPLVSLGYYLSGADGFDEVALLEVVSESLCRDGGDVAERGSPRRPLRRSQRAGLDETNPRSTRVTDPRYLSEEASGRAVRPARASNRTRLVRR